MGTRVTVPTSREYLHNLSIRHQTITDGRYLDQLRWEPSLGKGKSPFVPAKMCSQQKGVLDAEGKPKPTLQRVFVDDLVYADIFESNKCRIEQTVAAGIESIFILLGRSDLSKRQDPVS